MTTEQTRQAAVRAAQEARRARQVRESATATARSIEREVPNISAYAAQSLGAAIDPSQGFSLDPQTRPAELPRPGSFPGGNVQRQTGDVFGAGMLEQSGAAPLVDDYDAVMTPASPNVTTAPMPARKEHPVLSRLREDLCVDMRQTKDVEVGGHVWSFVVPTPGDVATAARLADQLAVGQTERMFVYETSLVAHAVAAIDHVPTYQVFAVEAPPGMVVTDPMRPPRSLRLMTAGRLYDFIIEQGKTMLASRLYEAYVDKVDAAGAISSYLDDPHKRKVQFVCEQPGCRHRITVEPRFAPGSNELTLPVCQWCAKPMKPETDVLEPNSPLT